MKVVIIGAGGHGKNTLAEAIKILTNTQCQVMNTNDLIQVSKEKSKLEKELKEISMELPELEVSNKGIRRKKGKEIKPWQKTKFYQK